MKSYSLIFGQGRSGTNWLLDLCNLSPVTFCRNEPDEIPASPFSQLVGHKNHVASDSTDLVLHWDDAVLHTLTHMGERDRRISSRKEFLWEPSRRFGLLRLVQGPRLRQTLGMFAPHLAAAEWQLPSWLGSRQRLEHAYGVIKINMAPGWASWVLNERPNAVVIHIVRHPGGFLQSWSRRYLAAEDPRAVAAANRLRLEQVASVEPGWGQRFGNLDALDVKASELWYWRYANEWIYEIGRSRPNYHLVRYEELVREPVEVTRRLYCAMKLTWESGIERAIRDSAARSARIASAWKRSLDPADTVLLESITSADQSELMDLIRAE